MKLTHFLLTTPITFLDDKTCVLQVESQKLFLQFVENLHERSDGETGDGFQIYDGCNDYEFSKDVIVLSDIFHLCEFNKKLNIKLQKNILQLFAKDIEAQKLFLQLSQQLIALVNSTTDKIDVPTEMSMDIQFQDFIKLLNISFANIENSTLGKLVDFINIISEFNLCKVLVLINIKCYFSDVQLEELFLHCKYKKIELLLLEHFNDVRTLKTEKRTIIDCDLCEIAL
ncbi:MAG: type II-A CRISPR-associated protein Csn2 [Clostridia bacterium]